MYGNDEISSNNYLDDIEYEDGENIRNFSGYDYHHKGDSYNPPLAKQPPPRKQYTDPPRKLYDLWRLKTPTKIREGFNLLGNDIGNSNDVFMLAIFLIFVMVIYCIALYKMSKKLDGMTSDIFQLLNVLKEGLTKTA